VVGRRIGYLTYGLVAYLAFVGVVLYALGFVGGWLVPRSIDAGGPSSPASVALAIDLSLLALFAVQHSVMARRSFKRVWTRLVPEPLERSTYVLCASACLALLFAAWRPLPHVLWTVDQPALRRALVALSLVGWGTALVSTFLIDHLHLFGVRQVSLGAAKGEPGPGRFRTPGLYRLVRHPLYLGFLVAFWAAPTMTVGHLVFSLAMLGYVLIGIRHEERDLVQQFGERYLEYRRRVRALIPLPRGRAGSSGRGESRTFGPSERSAEG